LGAAQKRCIAKAAELAGFEAVVTSDKNIRYQQSLANRKIAIVVLPSGRWPQVKPQLEEVVAAIDNAVPGSYKEILWRSGRPQPWL